jgi:hypothetical protein
VQCRGIAVKTNLKAGHEENGFMPHTAERRKEIPSPLPDLQLYYVYCLLQDLIASCSTVRIVFNEPQHL